MSEEDRRLIPIARVTAAPLQFPAHDIEVRIINLLSDWQTLRRPANLNRAILGR